MHRGADQPGADAADAARCELRRQRLGEVLDRRADGGQRDLAGLGALGGGAGDQDDAALLRQVLRALAAAGQVAWFGRWVPGAG